MQDILQNIREYEASRSLVQKRIQELNVMIGKCKPCKEDSSLKSLLERRARLYTQIWDMEFAIRSMREYIDSVNLQGVNQKVG